MGKMVVDVESYDDIDVPVVTDVSGRLFKVLIGVVT